MKNKVMNFQETILFYVVIGLGVAAAFGLTERRRFEVGTALSMLGAVLFWPIYLPLLLSGSKQLTAEATPGAARHDELSAAIEQIERELDAALAGLDGWAEHVLNRNSGRLGELRTALVTQADRIREMDALLARTAMPDANDVEVLELGATDAATAAGEANAVDERRRKSVQARRDNIERLAEIRRRARSDLLDTFAWIRELVSMIHLAKFTGAPASRAEELVAQIAAAVESISIVAVTEPRAAAKPPEKQGSGVRRQEAVVERTF